jgi:AraC-like DNA-binding protein
MGRHGVRAGAWGGRRVTCSVSPGRLRCSGLKFVRALSGECLAAVAGMSTSSFHRHFRSVTSLSPLQSQKQLRLIEARRLMLSEGRSASSAASAVGYESAPQFTREYGRMFGWPPVRIREWPAPAERPALEPD